jgi:hypothetical protein
MKLPEFKTEPLSPIEEFQINGENTELKLVDFWAWSMSDLVENRNRGILAEFIVLKGLGLYSNT